MGKNPLLDDLANPEPPQKRGYPCGVGRIMSSLETDERSAVQDKIDQLRVERNKVGANAETTFTAKWLAEVLTRNAHPVSALVMQNHVRKACSCGY